MNTDAVDNSAGVDCSDNEVNIKILLIDQGHLQDLFHLAVHSFIFLFDDTYKPAYFILIGQDLR